MKNFTNLIDFKNQLKLGNKLAIVSHTILSNGERDDVLQEGIICEVADNYFTYEYSSSFAKIKRTQLDQPETTWSGSSAHIKTDGSFCSIYHSNMLGESSTILYKSVDGCFTFAIHPDEPSCCPVCKGSGMNYTTISTFGEKEKQISIGVCYDCKGKSVNKKEGKAIQKHIEELEASWCNCGSEDSYYVPDRKGEKHHWNCGCCHKLKQVG